MEELIKFGIGMAAAAGALAWLARAIVTKVLDSGLERYKHSLQLETQKTIEQFKSHLEVEASQRRSRLGLLEEKRAQITSDTYTRLRETYAAVTDFVSPVRIQDDEEVDPEERVRAAIKSFGEYYPAVELYFPKSVAKKVRTLHNDLTQLARRYKRLLDSNRKIDSEIEEELSDKIRPAFEEVMAEFQALLGVDNFNQSA